jgi:hypothetical protein
MVEERRETESMLNRVWRWIRGQFVQEVPEGAALCEF